MLVRDLVNPNSVRISLSATIRQAAEVLSATHASDLMVIDADGQFVGVLSEGDLLRKCLPQFESLIQAGSLSAAEDLFQDAARAMADQSIEPLVLRQIVTLKPTDKVVNAAGLMISKMIRCLPVVEDRRLIGTVSRSDIARGALAPRA